MPLKMKHEELGHEVTVPDLYRKTMENRGFKVIEGKDTSAKHSTTKGKVPEEQTR